MLRRSLRRLAVRPNVPNEFREDPNYYPHPSPPAFKYHEDGPAKNAWGAAKLTNLAQNISAATFAALKKGPKSTEAFDLKIRERSEAVDTTKPSGAPAEFDEHEMAFIDLAERHWAKCPDSPLNTIATRKEWFRVMQYNTMCDTQTVFSKARVYPTPLPEEEPSTDDVAAHAQNMHKKVMGRAPQPWEGKKSKKGSPVKELTETDPDAFTAEPVCNVDSRVPKDITSWEARCGKILKEIEHYDPDIIVMNEVNRVHFNTTLWKKMRANGYGCTYTSARSRKPMKQYEASDPMALRDHRGKRPYEDDIGNAIFYHKGRFFPEYTPGRESPDNIPYCNVTGLRDRITNLHLLLFCVQLTPGDEAEAVKARENEVRGIFKVVDAATTESSERNHMSVMVLGDFNNVEPEEPCVTLMRDKYRSAYDAIGGCRWTQWHFIDKERPYFSKRHTENDYEKRNRRPEWLERKDTVEKVKKMLEERAAAKLQKEEGDEGKGKEADVAAAPKEEERNDQLVDAKRQTEIEAERQRRAEDQLEHQRAIALREKGIVKRTSDFIFYQSKNLTPLKVLDVPSDSAVDQRTLLPNKRFPSHHVSLVSDFCWNTFYPEDITNVPWK